MTAPGAPPPLPSLIPLALSPVMGASSLCHIPPQSAGKDLAIFRTEHHRPPRDESCPCTATNVATERRSRGVAAWRARSLQPSRRPTEVAAAGGQVGPGVRAGAVRAREAAECEGRPRSPRHHRLPPLEGLRQGQALRVLRRGRRRLLHRALAQRHLGSALHLCPWSGFDALAACLGRLGLWDSLSSTNSSTQGK